MKKLKPLDLVFYTKIQTFAKVLEVDGDDIKISYTLNPFTKPKGVVETIDRAELKKYGDTTPTKRKAKTVKAKPRKAKAKPSDKELKSVLELLD